MIFISEGKVGMARLKMDSFLFFILYILYYKLYQSIKN